MPAGTAALSTPSTTATPVPSISLSLPGSALNLGSSMNATATLSAPAGSSGTVLSISSSSPALDISPSTVTIASGATTGTFTVRGLGLGSAQLSVTALGYTAPSPQTVTIAQPQELANATVTTVENLGTVSAAQAATGLGFNIESNQGWEFQMAQQVGSTRVRFDCAWNLVELQTANNTSGGYSLPDTCAAGLANSLAYGQHPQVNALYGPPTRSIETLAATASTPTGSYSIPVSTGTGPSLQSLAASCFDSQGKPLCEIILASGTQITPRWDYAGSLITGFNASSGSVTLAAATTVALNSGASLTVNQMLYSPILLPTGGSFTTDPSTQAYAAYVHFLAQQIASTGVSGEVGLYNEPNWMGGLWLHGQMLYDTPPASSLPSDSVSIGVPLAVAATAPVPGVKFVSNFTNKTGFGALIGWGSLYGEYAKYINLADLQGAIASEAFHPYGNNPEDQFWSTQCLQDTMQSGNTSNIESQCALPGGNTTSNFKDAVALNYLPAAGGGIAHSITETGLNEQIPNVTARFDLRQFIGYQALGVSPILFYKLTNSGEALDWVNPQTQQPYQVYNDFMPLMRDFQSISLPPLASAGSCSTPEVSSYLGYYPLDTATFIGTAAKTDRMNSVLFFSWQQSSVSSGNWYQMTSPAAVPVTVTVPAGLTVAKAMDTVTLAPVQYTLQNGSLTYSAADNPIEILLTPEPGATAPSSCGTDATGADLSGMDII